MNGYRHEGGDGSVARTEIARWSEPQGLQARQRNGKDLHIVVRQVEGTTFSGGTIGVHAQLNQIPELRNGR